MTLYNITRILSNSTNYLSLLQNVNDAYLEGFLGVFLLVGVCTVFFWAFFSSTKNVSRSVSATSFILFVLSMFLYMIGLVNNKVIIVTLICAGLAVAFTWKNN